MWEDGDVGVSEEVCEEEGRVNGWWAGNGEWGFVGKRGCDFFDVVAQDEIESV